MQLRRHISILLGLLVLLVVFGMFSNQLGDNIVTRGESHSKEEKPRDTDREPTVTIVKPPQQVTLPQSRFVSQTFNNCGPASLSMVLSLWGVNRSQEELASKMRPFNNPAGGVDDKSIFAPEFVKAAKEQGLQSLHRPNGDIDLLKKLTANGIPVVVRTWLNPEEDIGHFRIVRGYDEGTRTILQDDSYQGPSLTYSYEEFNQMWKPFNYGYILVYPQEKQETVEAILGEELDEKVSWQHALQRAERQLQQNQNDPYALFNIATAEYYLGNYDRTVTYYEQAREGLPARMLWYQLEPLQAYLKTKQYEKVFSLTDTILNNGNMAYTELYLMRGQAYLEQGRVDDAEKEFEKAVYYNSQSEEAKTALSSVQ